LQNKKDILESEIKKQKKQILNKDLTNETKIVHEDNLINLQNKNKDNAKDNSKDYKSYFYPLINNF